MGLSALKASTLAAGGPMAVLGFVKNIIPKIESLIHSEGFAWPGAKWVNHDKFTNGLHLDQWQIWTEEWTGRVFCYEFTTADEAEKEMDHWHVSRILMHWNGGDVLEPTVLAEKGMQFAHATIKKVAHLAYVLAFQDNMKKLGSMVHAHSQRRRLANDLEKVSEVEVVFDGEEVRRVVQDEIV